MNGLVKTEVYAGMLVLNWYILITLSFYFMMYWGKAQISKHPVVIVRSVYTLQSLCSYSKVSVIYS